MISNTSETVFKIDDLILQLISELNKLEHELRFQPHAKIMIDKMKEEIMRLFKQHQTSFVKPLSKGWIY